MGEDTDNTVRVAVKMLKGEHLDKKLQHWFRQSENKQNQILM